jgi:acyl carrier protein
MQAYAARVDLETVVPLPQSGDIPTYATLPGESLGHLLGGTNESGSLVMCIHTSSSSARTIDAKEGFAGQAVRTLIAEQLGIEIERVTDEASIIDDLGADWLDRLELMIAIEDHFADVEITDDDVDQLDVVGDLIRHVEHMGNSKRGRRSAVGVELPLH